MCFSSRSCSDRSHFEPAYSLLESSASPLSYLYSLNEHSNSSTPIHYTAIIKTCRCCRDNRRSICRACVSARLRPSLRPSRRPRRRKSRMQGMGFHEMGRPTGMDLQDDCAGRPCSGKRNAAWCVVCGAYRLLHKRGVSASWQAGIGCGGSVQLS